MSEAGAQNITRWKRQREARTTRPHRVLVAELRGHEEFINLHTRVHVLPAWPRPYSLLERAEILRFRAEDVPATCDSGLQLCLFSSV